MKKETNNEMDLLLRRLGRRDDAVISEDHLDADELSAYAENALPAAARARYTVHLAECAGCRSIVVQLSSSAGVVATTDSVAVTEPSGFRKFLASLFTPMVLRYAAPALGLIVVAVIGFVVLRREQAERFVAPDTTAQQHPDVAPAARPFQDEGSSKNTASPGLLDGDRQEKNQQAQPAPPPNAPPVVSSVESDVSKDKAAAQPKAEEQPAAANEPPPAKPEPTPTPEQSPRADETEVTKKEVKDLPATRRSAEKTLQAAEWEARKNDNDNFARARKPADSAGARRLGSVANLQVDGIEANSRTVAGRRFHKKGGVWIDTAYDSSKDVVTLTRGSEQYRALVADEPAIKTIADQLEGEILVVWKGHTYRIR
jgi:Putative zinc-finger